MRSWFLTSIIYLLGVEYAVGEMAAPTKGVRVGAIMPEPTTAPSRELVRARLQQRATSVYCDEWDLVGNNGRPRCSAGETCLFQSVNGMKLGGCMTPGNKYDWVTACWESKTGSAPLSESYCTAATAKFCGLMVFVVSKSTYTNFGCSSERYTYTATLLDSLRPPPLPSSSTVTSTISTSSSPVPAPAIPTPPITVETKDNTVPIGAIAGGAAGGIGVLACLAALIFLLLRKKRKSRVQHAVMQTHQQQQQADAATATAYFATQQQSVAEIEGKPTIVQHQPPRNSYRPPEKVVPTETTQEVSRLQSPATSFNHSEQLSNASSSPPPVYTQPSSPLRPLSGFSELEQQRHASTVSFGSGDIRPISGFTELEQHTLHHTRSPTLSSIPASPSTSSHPPLPVNPPLPLNELASNRSTQGYVPSHSPPTATELAKNPSTQPHGNASELDSQTHNIPFGVTELPSQRMYQTYSPPPTSNRIPTLSSLPSRPTPPAGNQTIYQAYSPPPTEQDISASTGSITRAREDVARTMSPRMDMSGAPMSEDYVDEIHERRGG